MVSIRIPVLILFLISLSAAGYLGFASIQLVHDKLVHFATFFVLTVEFYFIFDTNHKSLKTLRYITLLVCTFAGALFSEVIQSLVNPVRVFDIYDIMYNVIGSGLGVVVCTTYDIWALKRQKKHRYRQVRDIIIEGEDDDDYTTEDVEIEIGSNRNTEDSDRAGHNGEVENGFVSINMEDLPRSSDVPR